MLYRKFGKLGWDISSIGLGTWNIGNQWGDIDEATAYATIRAAWDSGVNLFDTAESYGVPNGLSEYRLGRGLAGIRHQTYVVSKIGYWGARTGQAVPKTTPDMIRLCAHASLYRLRSDYIDVLLCHESSLKEPDIYLEGFEQLKQSGEIRAYGISTDSLEVLKRFNVNGTCHVVELDYSLINRQAENELLPYCEEHGIAVLVRGPLAQGLLSGGYNKQSVFTDSVREGWNVGGAKREVFERKLEAVERIQSALPSEQPLATVALQFAISHRTAPVAIPGAKSPEQARQNALAGETELSEEWLRRLAELQ
jgi:myo-inositol catabolism protein IolS